MGSVLTPVVERLLRVPPEPSPPAGSHASVRIFRAAQNYYRYSLAQWGLKQLGALFGLFWLLVLSTQMSPLPVIPWERIPLPDTMMEVLQRIGLTGEGAEQTASSTGVDRLFSVLELIGLVLFVAQIPLTYAMVRLDYQMRWYIVTDRSLRIREGIWRVREMTMTFANIQHLTVEQGPLQRLLGISDLKVRTAGGGASESEDASSGRGQRERESMHVGFLRGVDNAREIRDTILARLRRLKDSGLGDPDDARESERYRSAGPGQPIAALPAARDVLGEARALRRLLETSFHR
ncbi:MAG: PH domain-containing protein [Acidobacteriota bacterium]|nr:MAG: PH domain-containing protein [Acidobacteriota bacterium]